MSITPVRDSIQGCADLSDDQASVVMKIVKDEIIKRLDSLARGTRECAANAALLSYTESNPTTKKNQQRKAVNIYHRYIGMQESIHVVKKLS